VTPSSRQAGQQERRRVVVVCEARADQQTACTLADRVLCEQSSWMEPEILDSVRQWCGLHPDTSFIRWSSVRREARERSIREHGRFAGEPGALDARAARRAMLVIESDSQGVAGVLLIRDSDNHLDRIRGLKQARECGHWSFAVVIGVAHTKRECWLLAAFQPRTEEDKGRLAEMRSELGFDPCTASQELTASEASAKRSAKRVLRALCGDDAGDSVGDLGETPLDILRERGIQNGLSEYLAEVEEHLLPLFG